MFTWSIAAMMINHTFCSSILASCIGRDSGYDQGMVDRKDLCKGYEVGVCADGIDICTCNRMTGLRITVAY
jgi:hypothetical protein